MRLRRFQKSTVQISHFTVNPFLTIPSGSVQSQGSPAGPRPYGQLNLMTLHSRSVNWSARRFKKPLGGCVLVPIRAGASLVSVVQPKNPRLSAKMSNAFGFIRNRSFPGKLFSNTASQVIAVRLRKKSFSICQFGLTSARLKYATRGVLRRSCQRNTDEGLTVAYQDKSLPEVSAPWFFIFQRMRFSIPHPVRASMPRFRSSPGASAVQEPLSPRFLRPAPF